MMKYIIYGFFIMFLIIISYIDLKTMKIPNKYNIIGMIVGLSTLYFNPFISWKSGLIGMILSFLILLIATVLTDGGFGAGDIKFVAVIGLFTGVYHSFYIILAAIWLQTIYLLISRKKSGPLGPMLSICSLIAVAMFFKS